MIPSAQRPLVPEKSEEFTIADADALKTSSRQKVSVEYCRNQMGYIA